MLGKTFVREVDNNNGGNMGQDVQTAIEKRNGTEVKAARESTPEKPKLTLGYNALQLGITPVEFGEAKENVRLRVYSNIGVENSQIHLRFQGLNEKGVNYSFGRNSLRVGKKDLPMDVVVASRYLGGNGDKSALLDVGVGVRVDLSKLPFIDYGFADILKQTGIGKSTYSGPELVTFWGKQLGPVTLESTMAKKANQPLFVEVEVLMSPVATIKGTAVKPYARSESFEGKNHTFTAGLQLQFPRRP